ncbi:MAG TPA: FtsX-like permease family protein [Polyangiaceae bacterium]|nr:FtsX-like permease family protein [Polyangiaceae bacterium]
MGLATIAARNILRNKLRTSLTLAGVMVAVVTFLLLRTFIWSWSASAEQGARDRIGIRHKVSFIMQLPRRYVDEVRGIPGVKQVAHASWFGAKDPNHLDDFFGTIATEPDDFLKVYDEIKVSPAEVQAWKEDREGALVGDVLAKKKGWKLGDKIVLQGTIYPGDWEFHIAGIYTSTSPTVDRSTLWFQYKYLDESRPERLKDQVGWIMARVDDPGRAAEIARAVDKKFDDRDIQTISMSERALQASFLGMISAILKLIGIVSIVMMAIMALILGNTIAMGVRERTHEYGVLRAIGFLPKHIVQFILVEGLVLGALGGLVGLAIGYPLIQNGIGPALEQNLGQMFAVFRVTPDLAGLSFLLALALGALAAVVPARNAAKLEVVSALRRVG